MHIYSLNSLQIYIVVSEDYSLGQADQAILSVFLLTCTAPVMGRPIEEAMGILDWNA